MNCELLLKSVEGVPLAGWSCAMDEGFLRLITPLRYPDGGTIELFVEMHGPRVVVSDMGEAFRYLETHGLDPLRSPSRQKLIDLAVELGDARFDDGVFEIDAADLGHVMAAAVRLGQVVTRVADTALSAKGALANTFSDAVEEFILASTRGVEVTRGGTVRGEATSHQIDIVARSQKGLVAIEGLTAVTPVGANAQTAFTLQKFVDIAALGAEAPARVAMIDDSAEVWSESLRRQLGHMSLVIDWERRDELLSVLGGNDEARRRS